jgi:hypothetical protein
MKILIRFLSRLKTVENKFKKTLIYKDADTEQKSSKQIISFGVHKSARGERCVRSPICQRRRRETNLSVRGK